jgi:hypothetical protein
VARDSARIGEALSNWEEGLTYCVNPGAAALDAHAGMLLHLWPQPAVPKSGLNGS